MAERGARFTSRAMAACLLLSGGAALIYEVVWARLLALVMGHTVYALSAVLSSFLGGLALGAWLMGRWTRKGRGTLALYAGIEAAIAAVALAMPWLIDACTPLFTAAYQSLGQSFVTYNLVQFAICGSLLLLPATLMGATLPLVVSIVLKHPDSIGRQTGWLYGANTLGGAVGAAAAGFALLPAFGMHRTGLVAAGTNLLVAGIAFALSRAAGRTRAEASRPLPPPPAAPDAGDWPAPKPGALVPIYLLAGVASLVLQVGWVRIVSLSIGSTTYGFSVTLVTFITGLGLGSYFGGRIPAIARRPVRAVFWLNIVIALWGLASLPYLGSLPIRVVQIVARVGGESFGDLLLGELLLVWSTILVPTLAMGAMFPLVAQLLYRSSGVPGHAVGRVYAANTTGNIIGAFIAGFVLIPWLGMRGTIVASAVLSACVAAAFVLPMLGARPAATLARLGAMAAALVAGVIWMPAWNKSVITSGPFLFASQLLLMTDRSSRPEEIRRALDMRMGELLDYAEGPTAVVSVRRMGQHYFLDVGGYTEGLRFGSTQKIISHLPLLLHGNPEDVLVVGLGGATTLASALRHPVKRVDVVEISEIVHRMAQKHFSKFTRNATEDPRVHLIIGDGRNHLRHSGKRYDVIVSQPSMPWVSGAAGLFTRGAFQDMYDRLKPGGIACIWYQSWAIGQKDMASLAKTWADVFPGAYLFESRLPGEIIMIGLRDGKTFDLANVARALAGRPDATQELRTVGIGTAGDLFSYLLLGPGALRRYAGDAPLNTDDIAYVEFTSPTGLLARDDLRIMEALMPFAEPPAAFIDLTDIPPEAAAALRTRLDGAYRSKPLILRARRLMRAGRDDGEYASVMWRAAKLNPNHPFVRKWAMSRKQQSPRPAPR